MDAESQDDSTPAIANRWYQVFGWPPTADKPQVRTLQAESIGAAVEAAKAKVGDESETWTWTACRTSPPDQLVPERR